MPIIILIVIALICLNLKGFLFNILTLSFLPGAFDISNNTNISSYTIPIIGKFLEPIINYFVLLFINIIDFIYWFFHWIPGIKQLTNFIYTSPDKMEKIFTNMHNLNQNSLHRYYITHSIINPIIIIIVFISVILIFRSDRVQSELTIILKTIIAMILLLFATHLFADTIPRKWIGFANIKIYFNGAIHILPPFLSKLWLFLNACVLLYIAGKLTDDMD